MVNNVMLEPQAAAADLRNITNSKGMMTLTRNPCDLDTMSLFQDLKLKRRKVDSRCSSDGESVAETSTSSPDMTGPVSPCPRHRSPSPEPDTKRNNNITPPPPPPPQANNVEIHSLDRMESESDHRPITVKQECDNCVFDGGGGGEGASGDITRKEDIKNADSRSSPKVIIKEDHVSVSGEMLVPSSRNEQQRNWGTSGKFPVIVERRLCSPEQRLNSPGAVQVLRDPVLVSSSWSSGGGRINGVRPELIGGGGVGVSPPTPTAPPTCRASPISGRCSGAPTVIMGEAGGVRTMIWSQPSPVSPPASTSAANNWSSSSTSGGASSNSSSEESAAQLLLNLGQPPPIVDRPQPQQPLNMERLWAGDLTQLPPSQQHHALNLAWPAAGRGGDHLKPPGATPTPIMDHHHQNHLHQQQHHHHRTDSVPASGEDDEQPMICMICEDKATGLHYGIITCEGCKGFFKRTVQNRRVYTCVADGHCEITKAQRNRCQYCRFKKCIEQGMVLQAVREDRMPGGRNSGAVYNLYKVKYKKHKKSAKNGQIKGSVHDKGSSVKGSVSPEHIRHHNQHHNHHHHHHPASHLNLVNGTILKTALTNPSESIENRAAYAYSIRKIVHLRQRLDNTVSSSRDRAFPLDTVLSMIQALIDCDEFQDIATLRNLDELLDHKSDLSEKLCQIGDSIVYKLVQWTKRLPFYLELPVEVHTRLLTHKWHELLVLTTSAYQAIHGAQHKLSSTSSAGHEADFTQEVSNNLVTLQTCLTAMMGRPITMDQLRQDVGLMVEKITHVTLMFRRVKLRMEEYVCLKVITMLNNSSGIGSGTGSGVSGLLRGGSVGGQSGQGVGSSPSASPSPSTELDVIQDRYMTCLKNYLEHTCPQQTQRFHDLLLRLPEIQSAASLLLESKMFYVPFLLNSAIQR